MVTRDLPTPSHPPRGALAALTSGFTLTPLAEITPRMNRNERQRDAVISWRDLPIAAFLRRLDPQGAAEQPVTRLCTDCPDPAVYRIGPKG